MCIDASALVFLSIGESVNFERCWPTSRLNSGAGKKIDRLERFWTVFVPEFGAARLLKGSNIGFRNRLVWKVPENEIKLHLSMHFTCVCKTHWVNIWQNLFRNNLQSTCMCANNHRSQSRYACNLAANPSAHQTLRTGFHPMTTSLLYLQVCSVRPVHSWVTGHLSQTELALLLHSRKAVDNHSLSSKRSSSVYR